MCETIENNSGNATTSLSSSEITDLRTVDGACGLLLYLVSAIAQYFVTIIYTLCGERGTLKIFQKG